MPLGLQRSDAMDGRGHGLKPGVGVARRSVAAHQRVQHAAPLLRQAADQESPGSDARDRIEIMATRSVSIRFCLRIKQLGHFFLCVVTDGNDGGGFRRFFAFTSLQLLIGKFKKLRVSLSGSQYQ